jgi:hypothetical protein
VLAVTSPIKAFDAKQSSTVPNADSSHYTTSAHKPNRLVLIRSKHIAKYGC